MSAQTVLKALAEPRRPAILRLVRDEARSVGEIAAHFDISQQAVSQHLQVLREAGLVEVRRDGHEAPVPRAAPGPRAAAGVPRGAVGRPSRRPEARGGTRRKEQP